MLEIKDIIGEKTFIIAEAGVNHNGNIETAKELIDVAINAKADAIKFQTFNTDKLVTKKAAKADYQTETTNANESQYEMLKKLELSKKDHKELISYCNEQNITFMSTPFDFESVDLLEKLGVDIFKIGSGDLTNIPLLKYIAELKKPMIVSTGMANLGEVEEAVNAINNSGNDKLILLHCVSNYPAAFKNVNLRAMNTLKTAFKVPVGYSDHTLGIEVSIASVALGAKVIEKHFTLNEKMEGPDHKASINPNNLKKMVKSIRYVERTLGNGIKKYQKSEIDNRKKARRSLIINSSLKRGTTITNNVLEIKRPGIGIKPKYKHEIIGMKTRVNVQADSILKWDMLEKKERK